MATKIYLPSSGAAPVTPADWEFANQINPLTFRGVTTKIASAMTTKTEATGTTNPTTRAMLRYVFGPLAGQTISGTLRGVIRCLESNAGANTGTAIAAKIIQPDGTDRAILLAPSHSDSTGNSPWEMSNAALTARRFWTILEAEPLTLTSGAATAGDYLVIEIGFRSATSQSRNISYRYGDAAASDLTYNDTDTDDDNPWVEFSGDIPLLVTGTLNVTLDNLSLSGVSAVAIAGSLVATLDNIAVPGDGDVIVDADANLTLDNLTLTGEGTVEDSGITGTANITLQDLTLTGEGDVAVDGDASLTLDNLTLTGEGDLAVDGDASLTLDNVTVSGIGVVVVDGDAALTLQNTTVSGLGQVAVDGDATLTLQDFTLLGEGSVTDGAPITGSAVITLQDFTVTGSGTVSGGAPAPAPVSTSGGGGRSDYELVILPEILAEERERIALEQAILYDNELLVIAEA